MSARVVPLDPQSPRGIELASALADLLAELWITVNRRRAIAQAPKAA